MERFAALTEDRLDALLPQPGQRPAPLVEAMRYACLGPGKRLRPALCLASCEAVGGDAETALNPACALELLHCFSLIHDDLPAIDDDDLRRGRPTVHVQFTEAMAILAGDGLFAMAFEAIVAPRTGLRLPPDKAVACAEILTEAAGMRGLVAGEAADILAEGRDVDEAELAFIHSHKTGALIAASCEMGAVVGTDDPAMRRSLRDYGRAIGLAFQIADDLLNETADSAQLGKAAGSDRARQKATYPALLGIPASRDMAQELVKQAVGHLSDLPGPTDFLTDLANFSISRQK